MRVFFLTGLLLLAACSRTGQDESPTPGESREAIKPRGGPEVSIRSGAEVAVSMPEGFSLYPDARVISNTIVRRKGGRHTLIVLESKDAPTRIAQAYRAQAEAAGGALSVDIAGANGASLGGKLQDGVRFSMTATKGPPTRVELAFD